MCVCVCVCFAAGETERVIDLYSKGATYLQNGISVVIAVDGETNVTSSCYSHMACIHTYVYTLCCSLTDSEYDKCERLREKMANNLDMVTKRVTDLCE